MQYFAQKEENIHNSFYLLMVETHIVFVLVYPPYNTITPYEPRYFSEKRSRAVSFVSYVFFFNNMIRYRTVPYSLRILCWLMEVQYQVAVKYRNPLHVLVLFPFLLFDSDGNNQHID